MNSEVQLQLDKFSSVITYVPGNELYITYTLLSAPIVHPKIVAAMVKEAQYLIEVVIDELQAGKEQLATF